MIRQFISGNRRRFAFAIAACAALVLVFGAAVAPSRGADQDFVIAGGGWGHGVGMSQYGAYGMALLDGADYEGILAHYYPGTTPSVLGDDLPAPEPLWVNLLAEKTRIDFHAWAAATGAVPVTVSRGEETLVVPAGAGASIAIAGVDENGDPLCTITPEGGEALAAGPCMIDLAWDGWEEMPSTVVTVDRSWSDLGFTNSSACTHADWNATPVTNRRCTYGRGTLHIRPDNDTTSFHLVAEIDVDDYVLGISEMPYYWGLPADGPNGFSALQAQAIAARSYALRRQADRGDPDERSWCWCHVYDTTADQRYVGWGHAGSGLARWIEAVRSTDGIVLTHPADLRRGYPIPAETFYSSSTYGRTEPSASGFGITVPYLQAVDDRLSADPALGNPYAAWTRSFTGAELATALGWPAGTAVESAEVVACSASGTAGQIRFSGGDRTVTKRARDLRSILGLRSAQITNVGNPLPDIPACPGLDTGRAPLIVGDVLLDDDARDDSAGNGDGIAACGEDVEIYVEFAAIQAGGVRNLTVRWESDDPHVRLRYNSDVAYPDLGYGSADTGYDDWDLAVSNDAPEGHEASFTLVASVGSDGPWRFPVTLPLACPETTTTTTTTTTTIAPTTTTTTVAPPAAPQLVRLAVDDGPFGDSRGNDDGRAGCGEVVEIRAELTNPGPGTLSAIHAELITNDPYLGVLYNTGSVYAPLDPGAAARNRNDWDLTVAADAPEGHQASLSFIVTAAEGGPWTIDATLPLSCPAATAPVFAGITVDDDAVEDSSGDGDGTAECGETIELYAALRDSGTRLENVSATLATTDPFLRLLYNDTSAYPALSGGTARSNVADWDLAVDPAVPDGYVADLLLDVRSDTDGPWQVPIRLPLGCAPPAPPITIDAITIDDGVFGDSVGDLDRVAECGEIIELYALLGNGTGSDLSGVVATFRSGDPYVTLLYNDSSAYPDIATGAGAENLFDWDLRVDASAPGGHRAEFSLDIVADQGTWTVTDGFTLGCTP
jgi:SpoIID/LytB domain protein